MVEPWIYAGKLCIPVARDQDYATAVVHDGSFRMMIVPWKCTTTHMFSAASSPQPSSIPWHSFVGPYQFRRIFVITVHGVCMIDSATNNIIAQACLEWLKFFSPQVLTGHCNWFNLLWLNRFCSKMVCWKEILLKSLFTVMIILYHNSNGCFESRFARLHQ